MGMIGYLLRVSEEELNEILEDSSILEERVFPEDDTEPSDVLDIDKTWEAITFVLTGYGIQDIDQAAAPFSWLLMSNQVIDEEQDLGYGPAQYLTVAEVQQVNSALDQLSVEGFRERFDGAAMNEAGIYPEIWHESDALDYLTEYFELLKAFFNSAAESEDVVITFIS
ncbi:DUF1877 domain-containing protein [Dyadobacter luteus]|uniref:DUF1877 domain-containing protein n=1 Tax=Dyadobacter luteus TaxID=2259619 RepID=A0A3D8YHM5_9BACT|nr:YfbM family protein [Dyadobacter luteus]REA64314.1 DUF1877 domain-containing protein [Dyadobacter luteus]